MNPAVDVELIKDVLIKKLSPWLIYLFGSAKTGKVRTDSDVDLAFLSDIQSDQYEVFLVAQELAEALGREVDLINLEQASEVFRAEIIGSRQVIYEADVQRRYWFETNVLMDYAILNERRQPVLDVIQERGTVYD